MIVRSLKGLEDKISVSVVHPTWQATRPDKDQHRGWVFQNADDAPVTPMTGYGSIPCTGCIPDTVNGLKNVREIYELSGDEYATIIILKSQNYGTNDIPPL